LNAVIDPNDAISSDLGTKHFVMVKETKYNRNGKRKQHHKKKEKMKMQGTCLAGYNACDILEY